MLAFHLLMLLHGPSAIHPRFPFAHGLSAIRPRGILPLKTPTPVQTISWFFSRPLLRHARDVQILFPPLSCTGANHCRAWLWRVRVILGAVSFYTASAVAFASIHHHVSLRLPRCSAIAVGNGGGHLLLPQCSAVNGQSGFDNLRLPQCSAIVV